MLKLPNLFRERLRATRVPQAAAAQPEPISNLLPYEDFVQYDGCTLVLLEDGSLGVAWALGLVGHEALTGSQLTFQMQAIVQALEAVAHEKATFQLIWDSSPSRGFSTPEYAV